MDYRHLHLPKTLQKLPALGRLICSGLITLLVAGSVHAADLNICVSDEPVPPLTFPDHDGQAQYLIRRAAQENGLTVQFSVLPWRRCLQELYEGKKDAAVVAYTKRHLPYVTFPLRSGRVDDSLTLGKLTSVAVRKSGSSVGWNGTTFSGLSQPVLISAGLVATSDKLRQLGVPTNDAPKSIQQMLSMLVTDRAQIGVLRESEAIGWITNGPFRGKVEVLPVPLNQLQAFLGFNQAFYTRHPKLAQTLWTAMARIMTTDEWRQLAPQLGRDARETTAPHH